MNKLKNYITQLIYEVIDENDNITINEDYNTTIKKETSNNTYKIIITTTDNFGNIIIANKEVKINNGYKTVIIHIPGKTWNDKLKEWNRCGYINIDKKSQMIPKEIEKQFVYKTYIDNHSNQEINSLNNDIIEQFVESSFNVSPDHTKFDSFFKQYKYITFGKSLSGNILCIPIPIKDINNHELNYHTMKDFIDNSPPIQQIIFWKIVSKIIKFLVHNKNHKIKVNTLGFHIPWFHFRIEKTDTEFSDILLNEIENSIKDTY